MLLRDGFVSFCFRGLEMPLSSHSGHPSGGLSSGRRKEAISRLSPLSSPVTHIDYLISLIQSNRQILDDGFRHSLYVFQDEKCHGTRLHAAVWEGELKRCPVWTAFGTLATSSFFCRRTKSNMRSSLQLRTKPNQRIGFNARASIGYG